jgi:hypothetical protein
MASVFVAHEPYVGVDESTRRALGQMDLEHPQLHRVLAAARVLGIKAKSPIFQKDCAAHVGFPSKKVALYVREKVELARYAVEYEKWKAHGWKMFRVSHHQLRMLTDEQIVNHLREALKEVRKQSR